MFLLCNNLNAQSDSIKFIFNNLGSFNPDNTYGGFDGGLGLLKVEISNYKYLQDESSIIVKGKVFDYDSNETFCDISIYFAGTEPYYLKIEKKSFLALNKLIVKRRYNVDCIGNFEVKIDLNEDNKFYFGIIGYSLLECIVIVEK